MSQAPWQIHNFPSTGTAASASTTALHKPSGATQFTQVPRLRALQVSLSGTAAGTGTLVVRDGASGSGTIILEMGLSIAANGSAFFEASNLDLRAPTNGQITIEFLAGTSSDQQSVNAQGDLVQLGAPYGI